MFKTIILSHKALEMFIKLKNGQYWVWSSKQASLDCMPWFKFNSMKEFKLWYSLNEAS